MEKNIKANITKIANMVMVFSRGKTVNDMRVSGTMVNSTAKVLSSCRMVKKKLVCGRMEDGSDGMEKMIKQVMEEID